MAQPIAINFTPPTAAPRQPRAPPTHPTGTVSKWVAIAAGSTANVNAMAATTITTSVETRLDPSCSASAWSNAESSALVRLICSASYKAVATPRSRLCYKYCPMMLIETWMN